MRRSIGGGLDNFGNMNQSMVEMSLADESIDLQFDSDEEHIYGEEDIVLTAEQRDIKDKWMMLF